VYKHGQEKADEIWNEIEAALVYDCDETLTPAKKAKLSINQFLREKAFAFHKSVYDNRPIYWPLTSKSKSYVVWTNIHAWHDATLNNILADFLKPEHKALTMKIETLRVAKATTTDNKDINKLEKEIGTLDKQLDELDQFILHM